MWHWRKMGFLHLGLWQWHWFLFGFQARDCVGIVRRQFYPISFKVISKNLPEFLLIVRQAHVFSILYLHNLEVAFSTVAVHWKHRIEIYTFSSMEFLRFSQQDNNTHIFVYENTILRNYSAEARRRRQRTGEADRMKISLICTWCYCSAFYCNNNKKLHLNS